jgi:hypothetical protein
MVSKPASRQWGKAMPWWGVMGMTRVRAWPGGWPHMASAGVQAMLLPRHGAAGRRRPAAHSARWPRQTSARRPHRHPATRRTCCTKPWASASRLVAHPAGQRAHLVQRRQALVLHGNAGGLLAAPFAPGPRARPAAHAPSG